MASMLPHIQAHSVCLSISVVAEPHKISDSKTTLRSVANVDIK